MKTLLTIVIAIVVFVGVALWNSPKSPPQRGTSSTSSDNSTIIITPDAWVCVMVRDGKNLDFEVQKVNGVKPKYYAATDMDTNHRVEMPDPNGNGQLGYGKTNICFLLKPHQGISQAVIKLIER